MEQRLDKMMPTTKHKNVKEVNAERKAVKGAAEKSFKVFLEDRQVIINLIQRRKENDGK